MTNLHLCLICLLVLSAAPSASAQLVDPPQLAGSVDTPNDAYDVLLAGAYALIADYSAGLHVVDISNPTSPAIVSTHNTPGLATHLARDGDIVFVADHALGGVRIVDVSNKLSPVYLTSHTNGTAVMVAYDNGLLAVGYIENKCEILDVTDLAHPQLLATYATSGPVRDAVFDGEQVLVTDSGFGLLIIDVSTPTSPTLIGSAAANRPIGIAYDENVAYVCDLDGLKSYDVGDRTMPSLLDGLSLPGPGVRARIVGTHAVMADHVNGGLQVVDVSSPANLVSATAYVTGNYANGVAVAGEYAYLVDGIGLKVFRIFDSTVPVDNATWGRIKNRFSNRK